MAIVHLTNLPVTATSERKIPEEMFNIPQLLAQELLAEGATIPFNALYRKVTPFPLKDYVWWQGEALRNMA